MGLYLIDYENVHEDGVSGVRNLKSVDRVIIFYGENIKSISFNKHVDLMETEASVDYVKMHKTAKNYLDFQLTTYLGYILGKGEKGPVYIISKDTGFDSVIDFWTGRNIKIYRQTCITDSVTSKSKHIIEVSKPEDSVKTANMTQTKQVKKNTKIVSEKTALPESFRKKIRTAIKSDQISTGQYSVIYRSIENSKSELELNNELIKVFSNTKGATLYNHVKDIYCEYQGK